MISVNDMKEHIRINLIDSRWKDQRESMLNKNKEKTKASDDEITFNIAKLAKHRPDIFGTKQEEIEQKEISTSRNLGPMDEKTYSNHKTTQNVLIPQVGTLLKLILSDRSVPASHIEQHCYKKTQDEMQSQDCNGYITILDECSNCMMDNEIISQRYDIRIQSFKNTVLELKDRLMDMIDIKASKQKITMQGIGILEDYRSLSSYKIESGAVLRLISP